MLSSKQIILARYLGVSRAYSNAWGNRTEVEEDSIKQVIGCLGYNAEDAEASVDSIRDRLNQTLAPKTILLESGKESLRLYLNAPPITESLFASPSFKIDWAIQLEMGQKLEGQIGPEDIVVLPRRCQGNRTRIRADLRAPLPEGYHSLTLNLMGRSSTSNLICHPTVCFFEEAFREKQKLFGIQVQLYSLRSKSGWGIGDFADLKQLVRLARELDLDFIGLNPLHAISLHNFSNFSPYSPSSRELLNPLYIAINEIPEVNTCEQYHQLLSDDGFLGKLTAASESPLVNYELVWSLKRRALYALYSDFVASIDLSSSRAKRFMDFCSSGGDQLAKYARFEHAGSAMRVRDPRCWGFPVWPSHVNEAALDGTLEVCEHEINFYKWIQWIAHEQLEEVSALCMKTGMKAGLYLDLALSSDRYGFDAWCNSDAYAEQLDVGAPPDILNQRGQNWGFAPLKPEMFFDSAFEAFRSVIRASMVFAGAIRIDHILGLMRLFCIPRQSLPNAGTYLRYFLKELMAVIALESKRNKCLVIGEDLGTVPAKVREEMHKRRILSYNVIQFMSEWGGRFLSSKDYPELSLVTPGTHDTATMSGWWSCMDIDVRQTLGLFPEGHDPEAYRRGRHNEKMFFLELLESDTDTIHLDDEQRHNYLWSDFSEELLASTVAFASKTPCRMVGIPIEDVLLMKEQVNVPGVTAEYPCWRNKLSCSIDEPAFLEKLKLAFTHVREG